MQILRSLIPAALFAALTTAPATADTRIFLLDNSDGYGVDSCLATSAPCGDRVAAAWCRSHSYARALDYGRVASVGGAVPVSAGTTPSATCTGPLCPMVVAITCTR